MSNIYNLEPPTKGKVVIHTSYGDIDIELWAKEVRRFHHSLHCMQQDSYNAACCSYGSYIVYKCVSLCLWLSTIQAPLACKNFVQLSLEGYYDNTLIHRVIRDFMIQMGDPSGT